MFPLSPFSIRRAMCCWQTPCVALICCFYGHSFIFMVQMTNTDYWELIKDQCDDERLRIRDILHKIGIVMRWNGWAQAEVVWEDKDRKRGSIFKTKWIDFNNSWYDQKEMNLQSNAEWIIFLIDPSKINWWQGGKDGAGYPDCLHRRLPHNCVLQLQLEENGEENFCPYELAMKERTG